MLSNFNVIFVIKEPFTNMRNCLIPQKNFFMNIMKYIYTCSYDIFENIKNFIDSKAMQILIFFIK